MRIAMVTETYPPEVNGVARTVGLMVEGLLRRDHAVQLVRPRQSAAEVPVEDERFREILCRGLPIPRYNQLKMGMPSGQALLEAWRAAPPDIVHIATEGPLGWSALSAARKLGLPVATDFHTNFQAYSRHYGFAWLARAVMSYLRRFHNRTDCTMVPTQELVATLAGAGFRRLEVVSRGVHAEVFSPAKRSGALRATWGATDETLVALCVSRFAPEKNFELVIEAYETMRAIRPDMRLVLVGDGPLSEALKARKVGYVIAGRLVNGALSAHYASADIFLFPSVTETFGNVTLEAMASGLAVVAYDYAAAREAIAHETSGLLARFDDRAEFLRLAGRLASDPEAVRRFGARAREASLAHTWERVVESFEAVLEQTAAQARPAAEACRAAA